MPRLSIPVYQRRKPKILCSWLSDVLSRCSDLCGTSRACIPFLVRTTTFRVFSGIVIKYYHVTISESNHSKNWLRRSLREGRKNRRNPDDLISRILSTFVVAWWLLIFTSCTGYSHHARHVLRDLSKSHPHLIHSASILTQRSTSISES